MAAREGLLPAFTPQGVQPTSALVTTLPRAGAADGEAAGDAVEAAVAATVGVSVGTAVGGTGVAVGIGVGVGQGVAVGGAGGLGGTGGGGGKGFCTVVCTGGEGRGVAVAVGLGRGVRVGGTAVLVAVAVVRCACGGRGGAARPIVSRSMAVRMTTPSADAPASRPLRRPRGMKRSSATSPARAISAFVSHLRGVLIQRIPSRSSRALCAAVAHLPASAGTPAIIAGRRCDAYPT